MKPKKSKKKLVVNKLTVSNLDMAQQKNIKGGLTWTCQCTEVNTCDCAWTGSPCISFYACL